MTGLAESLEKRLQIGDSGLPQPVMATAITYRRLAANDRRQKNRDSGIGSDSGTAIMTTSSSLSDSDSAASHLSAAESSLPATAVIQSGGKNVKGGAERSGRSSTLSCRKLDSGKSSISSCMQLESISRNGSSHRQLESDRSSLSSYKQLNTDRSMDGSFKQLESGRISGSSSRQLDSDSGASYSSCEVASAKR